MRIMSAEIDDIKRVLAICFRTGTKQSPDDLERILCFDMGWMDTDLAHDSINALTIAGWMKNEDGMLLPNCDLKGVNAPLGWQPRPSRLTDPVVNKEGIETSQDSPEHTIEIKEDKTPIQPISDDPRSKLENRLLKFIARKSGIEKEEISRRVQRKMKALKYCTNWLAMCLVSKEQQLEMDSIIESLSVS